MLYLVSIFFPFLFVLILTWNLDFNLILTVVKADEIRGLKQLFTPCFQIVNNQ